MGRFTVNGMDKLMASFENIADIDKIAPKMCEAAGKVLERNLKEEIASEYERGDMYNSIKPTKVKKVGDKHVIVVRPTGKNRHGERNMAVLMYLNYGYQNIKAKRFVQGRGTLKKVISASKGECEKVMQEVWERETKG